MTAKTAKDYEMTATPQDHKSATFTFTHADKTFTIPAFASLPIGVIRKARKAKDDADMTFMILESVLVDGSPELDALDSMDRVEFDSFLQGWTQGAPLGESVSSEN